jgi:predicted TIM-barrel fold metal-dependent hydrolase
MKRMERIDCHCHIFNILTVGWRIILKQLSDIVSEQDISAFKSEAKSKIGKIAGLIKAFTKDSKHIFKMLDREYDEEYKLFVLMFDGDFLLDSSVREQLSEISGLIKDVCTIPVSNNEGDNGKGLSGEDADIKLFLDFLNNLSEVNSFEKIQDSHKDGFMLQYEQIKEMSENPQFKDRLIPFLGVDPRRPDIRNYLNQVGKGKLFAGIKVYPPNGFSPCDSKLTGPDSVFKFCSKNHIPVITHCSYGGFATPVKSVYIDGMIIPKGRKVPEEYNGIITFEKGLLDGFDTMVTERAAILNHPKIWEQVLKKYNDLILVLAHFGDGNNEWQDEIVRMMLKYDNLYTDISCISDDVALQRIKRIYKNNQAIQNKILYGSDFFLDLLFNDSFRQYKDRIERAFGTAIFDRLSVDNPAGFMAKWYQEASPE